MPNPANPPPWMMQELMARWDAMTRARQMAPPEPSPEEKTTQGLHELGYDGSRLRRRYWKKVTEI